LDLQWVLIRGLTREAGHWGEFPEYLSRAFPGSQVETLDLFGAGAHFRVTAPVRITDYVEALHQQLEAAPRGKRRILVTLSMASMVALEWMKRYPSDFDGAVLMNGSASRISPLHRRLRLGASPHIVQAALTQGTRRERIILNLTSNDRQAATAALPHWVEIARQRPVRLMNALRQLLAAALFRPPRFKPEARLLFLNSQGDRIVHSSCSAALQAEFGGELKTHEFAGHDLPLDAPAWVTEQISGWLAAP
jgi:pimeloyl-ACP methyl ester carboxylesterase